MGRAVAMNAESELRRRLRELRRADEVSAPRFHELLSRRRHAEFGRRRAPAMRLVASIAAVGALAVALTLLSPPRPVKRAAAATPSLRGWSAPTDFLLETPGKKLLDSTPRIGGRLPDISTDEPTKGPER